MRVFKVELPVTLGSLDPDLDLTDASVRQQLYEELESLNGELSETIRQRVATYFPPSYTIFARCAFPIGNGNPRVTVWIDDPTVRWPSGLFARRAWTLSVPILSHIVRETFEARLPAVQVDLNERKARIASLAPTRGWLDPVILSIAVALLSAGVWLVAYPWLVDRLTWQ